MHHSWKRQARYKDRESFTRKATLGNMYESSGGHTIEIHKNYNGSGPSALGGSKEWPVVTSKIAFITGQEDVAMEFAEALSAFTDRWLRSRSL